MVCGNVRLMARTSSRTPRTDLAALGVAQNEDVAIAKGADADQKASHSR